MACVDHDKKLDVVDWRDAPRPVVSRTYAPSRGFSPAALGVFGTLLVHALIVPSAFFGVHGTRSRQPEIQEPSAFNPLAADSTESLVLITLPTRSNSSAAAALDDSLLPVLNKLARTSPVDPDPPKLLNVDILSLGEEQASQTTTAQGDGAEQARLFGLYTGQIQSRINRAWRRPRTPVQTVEGADTSDVSFQCEAQVVQDGEGNVLEILLPRCNGSSAWQLSLVTAIRQASPLPAPPNPSVFSRSITLKFVGVAYGADSHEDEYEIPPREQVQVLAAGVR
jgi:hypothetical protein